MEQIWFITGSSRGLGRAITRAALGAGDMVAATARQPAQLDDLVIDYGERIHPIELDVTDAQAARSAIDEARRHFGRLDVIVNNALRARGRSRHSDLLDRRTRRQLTGNRLIPGRQVRY